MQSVIAQKLLMVVGVGGDVRVFHWWGDLWVAKIVSITNLEASEVRRHQADDECDDLKDEELVDEVGIVGVSPTQVILRIRAGLGRHQTERCELTLLAIAVPVRHDDWGEEENSQEVMAEDADHPASVDPAAQNEKQSIHSHENKREASQRVNNWPLAAVLLALFIAGRIDRKLQLEGFVLIRVGLVDELDVVEGGVLPESVIIYSCVVEVVLDRQYISKVGHLVGTEHQGDDESDEATPTDA